MTNFDPGGFLVLLTVIPAVAAGASSIALAHLASRLGYGDYETNVVVILGLLVAGWIGAALLVSTGMLSVLVVALSMVGAYVVTRSITAASYGWVLGVVLVFGLFVALSAVGIYQGVDETGVPRGLLARHFEGFYAAGLLVSGAIAGRVVHVVRRWRRRPDRGGTRA